MTEKTLDRDEILAETLAGINKQFGKGSIATMGDRPDMEVEAISTGILPLDIALGIGGLPRGRVVELYGPESGGKSTLAMHVVAEAQRNGGICAYIDVEHAMDPIYTEAIGVNVAELLISQPNTAEEALEIANTLAYSKVIDVIVIDSVAALVPRAEIEGDAGDSHIGLQARLMSQALRRLTGGLSKSNTMAIFVNQLRDRVGITWGSPEITSGGKALKFYASVRLDIRRIESVKNGDEIVANKTRVKVVKNKVAVPYKQAEFNIIYGVGADKIGAILDTSVDLELVKKGGAWYSYKDDKIGQGRENARVWLGEHPAITNELLIQCRQKAGLL